MDRPLVTSLAKIQAQLKAPKTQYNSFGKYNYRKAEDILEAVKPFLAAEGLVLTLSDDLELIGDRYYIKATAMVRNAANDTLSCEAYAREEEHKSGMDAAQVTGSASSYARKYALNGLFCIDDTDDPDTTNDGTSPIPTLPIGQYNAIVDAYAKGQKTKEGGDYRETLIKNYKPTKAQLKAFDADVDKIRSGLL